jgi:hypothetical protein
MLMKTLEGNMTASEKNYTECGCKAIRDGAKLAMESVHGSLKSPVCSCVSMTLPASSLNANHGIMRAAGDLAGQNPPRPEQMKAGTRRKSPTRRKTTRPTNLTPSCFYETHPCGVKKNLQDRKRKSRRHVSGCETCFLLFVLTCLL